MFSFLKSNEGTKHNDTRFMDLSFARYQATTVFDRYRSAFESCQRKGFQDAFHLDSQVIDLSPNKPFYHFDQQLHQL